MAVKYPTNLPVPVRDGYNGRLARKFTRLEMDDGGSRSIRRYAAQPFRREITFHYTWAQLELFEAWLDYDCQGGALDLDIPLNPTTNIVVTLVDDPQISYDESKGHWVVKLIHQEILPGPIPSVAPPSLPSWPLGLPYPEKSSYGYVKKGVIRSNINMGHMESRRRFRQLRSEVTIALDFTATQKATFDDFFQNTLFGGLGWCLMPLTAGNGVKMVRAKFIEPPEESEQQSWYRLTAKVETFELPMMSEFDYRIGAGLQLNDTYRFQESGMILVQDYIDASYFAEDYIGDARFF